MPTFRGGRRKRRPQTMIHPLQFRILFAYHPVKGSELGRNESTRVKFGLSIDHPESETPRQGSTAGVERLDQCCIHDKAEILQVT